ncbi:MULTISPECIES: hypothetical protein [Pseudomonas]|uniref:hypothetical protein n=1 Tax=Pseudomonas TaxID=286 RepID=UPI0001CC25DB|nr:MULTISPECIES: hypothetical protein [Pseudomonas]KEZ72146.1 hypothetical protein C5I_0121145 [Pseudomonas syringae pv. syringae FF5]MBP1120130.1 hypothetical protein [Pseudomonas sp. PvP028]MBS7438508.1 hypothetical protein [Pseudomonas syringae]QWB05815.1 hypothetical protein KLC09_19515 [Pseudomonas syringae]
MSTNNEILYVKDHFCEIESLGLSEAISKFSNVDSLLVALLNSLGFSSVFKESVADLCVYYVMEQSVRRDLLVFDSKSYKLLGNTASDLEAAFGLVKAIEGRLSDAMYFPPDLRKKVISSVIADLGVTEEFYAAVLSNWKAYR